MAVLDFGSLTRRGLLEEHVHPGVDKGGQSTEWEQQQRELERYSVERILKEG